MSDLGQPTTCSIPNHALLVILVNEAVTKADPVGAFESTGSYSEYLPEVPHLVDLVLKDEVSFENVRAIFNHFFFDDYASKDSIIYLTSELHHVRELWENNNRRDLKAAERWKMIRREFAEALISRKHDDPMCTCPSCIHFDRLLNTVGLTFGDKTFEFVDLTDAWTGKTFPNSSERRSLLGLLLSMQRFGSFTKPNIFEGWMEVPMEIGDLLHHDGWRDRLRAIENLEPYDFFRRQTIVGFVEAVAEKFLTDEYLNAVNNNGPMVQFD